MILQVLLQYESVSIKMYLSYIKVLSNILVFLQYTPHIVWSIFHFYLFIYIFTLTKIYNVVTQKKEKIKMFSHILVINNQVAGPQNLTKK